MKKTKFFIALSFLITGLLAVFQNMTSPVVPPSQHIISVGPDDPDPLLAAHSIVKSSLKNEDAPVIVEFKAGTYYAQSIIWTALPKNYSITFKPEKGSENQVIFDGRSSADEAARDSKGIVTNLFSFRPKKLGQSSNITVDNLTVQFYLEGINFIADRDDHSKFIGNNKVLNSSFLNIGNVYAGDDTKPGQSVIRLVNSRDGIFKGNRFENINNHSGSGQHAFYIAHFSENNLIEGNEFINHKSGSVVKLRDQSHHNKIISNVFKEFHPYAIQAWHCDSNQVMAGGKTRGFKPNNKSTGCTKFNEDDFHKYGTFSNTESFSYGAEERGNSFLQDGKQASDAKRICIYQNPKLHCDPAYNNSIITSDKKNSFGHLISSRVGEDMKYAICSSPSDCVDFSNSCFQHGKGSPHQMCEKNVWITCNKSNLGKKVGNKICLSSKNNSYTVWGESLRTFPEREKMNGERR